MDDHKLDNFEIIAYAIMYVVLVIETIMFLIIYIKRLFMLALYTMIAPLVAFMYPLDKLGDGKAQALNTWLKDYFFTLLTQPLHLLLYTIFIVSSMSLINGNVVYALCMYAMMIPGEKYIKKILGFEKAGASGGLGLAGAVGGGLAMQGLGKLTGLGPPGHGPKGGGSKGEDSKLGKIRKRKLEGAETSMPSSSGLGSMPGSSGSERSGLGIGGFGRRANSTRNGNIPGSRGSQQSNRRFGKKRRPFR